MGFTPAEIDKMSIWQFKACVEGYIQAHSSEKAQGMAQDERAAVAAGVLALS